MNQAGERDWIDRLLPGRMLRWRHAIRAVRHRSKQVTGRMPALMRPQRYSEKIQLRKLFDLNPAYMVFSDKYATRAYVGERLGSDHLPALYWIGDDPAAIPFEHLQPPYVVKSTHGYGQVAIVGRGGPVDAEAIRAKARDWLGYDHTARTLELGYEFVPRRLIVEELLTDAEGRPLIERKIFVYGGRARFVESIFIVPEAHARFTAFHTADWTLLDWRTTRQTFPGDKSRPKRLDDMLAAAERLAAGFDHLRIDLYDDGDMFKVGEITVYSWSGLCVFKPDQADFILGEPWQLRRPALRAVLAMLLRRREIRPRRRPSTLRS